MDRFSKLFNVLWCYTGHSLYKCKSSCFFFLIILSYFFLVFLHDHYDVFAYLFDCWKNYVRSCMILLDFIKVYSICVLIFEVISSVYASITFIKFLLLFTFSSYLLIYFVRYLKKTEPTTCRLEGDYHIFNTFFFGKLEEALSQKVCYSTWKVIVSFLCLQEITDKMLHGTRLVISFYLWKFKVSCSCCPKCWYLQGKVFKTEHFIISP